MTPEQLRRGIHILDALQGKPRKGGSRLQSVGSESKIDARGHTIVTLVSRYDDGTEKREPMDLGIVVSKNTKLWR
jgi:hypothetical protein